MADFGLRISNNGKDVKTDNDLDMALTSKYFSLKQTISGTGSFGSSTTITIAHGLGYIPICLVAIKPEPTAREYLYSPTNVITYAEGYWCFYHYADATNLYIKYPSNTGAFTVTYKYFIHADKGKV